MTVSPQLTHCITALVNAPASRAFEFLADPVALGGWSLGSMNIGPTAENGFYTGRSLFTGAQARVVIDPHPQLLMVDYRTGAPDEPVPRISARVVLLDGRDSAARQCYVTLSAWRSPGMTDERWAMLCGAHEA